MDWMNRMNWTVNGLDEFDRSDQVIGLDNLGWIEELNNEWIEWIG